MGGTIHGGQAAMPAMAQVSSDEFTTFSDKKGTNLGLLFCWFGAIIALIATILFGLMQYSSNQRLNTKKGELEQVVSDINSRFSGVESQATSFKSAVAGLAKAEKDRYEVEPFLKELYTKISKNVVIRNLSINSDGRISIDGNTDSYRSVADQMVTLKEWKSGKKNILKNVELKGVSENINSGTPIVQFSLSAQIDKDVSLELPETADLTGESTGADSEADSLPDIMLDGGDDAEI
ncbi:MAG: PilN domain-containing protein [Patescibacteria group bacterium]